MLPLWRKSSEKSLKVGSDRWIPIMLDREEPRRDAMEIIRQLVCGENDHEIGNPMNDRGFALLMAMVAAATLAFGLIVHSVTI